MSYWFGTDGTQNTNSMDISVNRDGWDEGDTEWFESALSEEGISLDSATLDDHGTGVIPIALEQRQAGHPGLPPRPGPPPARPLPPTPTSRTKKTPRNAQNPTSQAQTIQEKFDGPVMDVLTTEYYQVPGDQKKPTTIYHSAGQTGIDETLVKALVDALKSKKLTDDQENKVFDTLGWQFLCTTCNNLKPARGFYSCSREFWDEKLGNLVFLHGECKLCDDERYRAAMEAALKYHGARPTRRRA